MSEHGLEEQKSKLGRCLPGCPGLASTWPARLHVRRWRHAPGPASCQSCPFIINSHRLGLDLDLTRLHVQAENRRRISRQPRVHSVRQKIAASQILVPASSHHPRTSPPISSPMLAPAVRPSVVHLPALCCPVHPEVFGTLSDADRNPASRPPTASRPKGPSEARQTQVASEPLAGKLQPRAEKPSEGSVNDPSSRATPTWHRAHGHPSGLLLPPQCFLTRRGSTKKTDQAR